MNKKQLLQRIIDQLSEQLLQRIIDQLSADQTLLFQAAKTAHAAATHEENIPDNKYATLGLEASYLAQAQANRAQDIQVALEAYRKVTLQSFDDDKPIRLTALVTLEDEGGAIRRVFVGPEAGGLKIEAEDGEVVVITPQSPLGRRLIGKVAGDVVEMGSGPESKEYEIVAIG